METKQKLTNRLFVSKWIKSYRADPEIARLADRHYSRQRIGSKQFVPPGRCLVLKSIKAFWVTSWPFKDYVRHNWTDAWICSAFRNEGPYLSSELIREAVGCTLGVFQEIPAEGMITFVNTKKVRKKRDWGRCFRKAGFKEVGKTKSGLIVLQLSPQDMPAEGCLPLGMQESLFKI